MNLLGTILHPRIFALGWREAGDGIGMTYSDPFTLRSRAYDTGRDWHRRLWLAQEFRNRLTDGDY